MEAPKTVEIELDEVDMKENEEKKVNADDLAYAIEDVPPWYLCIFLGFQVRFYFLLMCSPCHIRYVEIFIEPRNFCRT